MERKIIATFRIKAASVNEGFTLLELLLASCLGSVLIITLMSSYALIAKENRAINELDAAITECNYLIYFLYQHFHDNTSSIKTVFTLSLHDYQSLKMINNSEGIGLTRKIGSKIQKEYFFLSETAQKDEAFYYKEDNKPKIRIASGIVGLKIWYGLKCIKTDNICHYVFGNQLSNDVVIRAIKMMVTIRVNQLETKSSNVYFAINNCESM